MANPLRGEVSVILVGRVYTMRPTFTALAEIENRLGVNLPNIAFQVASGTMKAMDIVNVLHAGIRAGENDELPTLDEIGEALMVDGFDAVQQPMVDFLESLLEFYSSKKKAPAAATPNRRTRRASRKKA